MIDSRDKISERIKEAREWKGLTQVYMANYLKVARQTYLDLESGKTEPKVRLLSEIADVTERPITWFIYGDQGCDTIAAEYKEDMDKLMRHFSRLPHSARNIILQHSTQMAGFMVEYTRALTKSHQKAG
ncbi:helix-turn-helix transcriptional regulator [Vibrio sp. Of7-15]|uniref:helix-turn-helix transcriptional regulator n=1 Tax=Vibrio sp. Of7-15 TaxID=2724879 RepID=UPI001EF25537|nr:helix-turn-helix transcriptional regulator [Vibrio sp. Of7-15]MCG7499271.1 helix-turn-helix transcriptional regulator [Vibrio sp. Of7-15]